MVLYCNEEFDYTRNEFTSDRGSITKSDRVVWKSIKSFVNVSRTEYISKEEKKIHLLKTY
jgi:hypothetical protein